MEQNQFLLDKQTLSVKPVTCSFEISVDGSFKENVIGISVIPYHFRIEPLQVKENLVRKFEDKKNILKELHEGKYYGFCRICHIKHKEIAELKIMLPIYKMI